MESFGYVLFNETLKPSAKKIVVPILFERISFLVGAALGVHDNAHGCAVGFSFRPTFFWAKLRSLDQRTVRWDPLAIECASREGTVLFSVNFWRIYNENIRRDRRAPVG